MPGTDFFDDDLARQRDRVSRIRTDEPAVPVEEGGSVNAAPRQVADLNLTRMARHRKEIDDQAAVALQELDKLRKRQEQLESEKRNLEDMRRRHDDYDRGKREMIDHLRRSLVTLERQEAETQRLTELYNATRNRFKDLLQAVESLNEESWPEEQIRDELNKALGIIEDARMEYNKSMARVDAERGTGGPAEAKGAKSAILFEDVPQHEEEAFGHWLKVGFAFSLPIAILIIVALVVLAIGHLNGFF
jgi:small-conductance mechanosensitive channel